jgi:hypothetical protein
MVSSGYGRTLVTSLLTGLLVGVLVVVLIGGFGSLFDGGAEPSNGGGVGSGGQPTVVTGNQSGSSAGEGGSAPAGTDSGSGSAELAVEFGFPDSCNEICQVTPLTITNVGNATATGVVAAITVVSGDTSITEDSVTVGALQPNQSAVVKLPVQFGVDKAVIAARNEAVTYTRVLDRDGSPRRSYTETCDPRFLGDGCAEKLPRPSEAD